MPVRSTASATLALDVKWQRNAATVALALLAVIAGSSASAQTNPPSVGAAGAAGAVTAPAVSTAGTADYAERYRTVCAACHGTNGRSELAGVPVLAGQYSLYTITQLFLYREGRRKNDAMIAMAKTMTDADLRGFSNFIGTLAAVPAPTPATPPDAVLMSKGQALSNQHKCSYCHGADMAGGQQVPRIGGQKEDYLRASLHGYKSGDRPGYTRAMSEALSQVSAEDLDLLAFYAANLTRK